MKDSFIVSDEEKELLLVAKYNDLLDVFLYLLGLLLLLTGDIIESSISMGFDVLMLIWFFKDKDIHYNAIWIFGLECLDLTDIIMGGGIFDVLGWIEIIPFWTLFYIEFKSRAKLKGQDKTKHAPSSNEEIEIPLEIICQFCGFRALGKITVCEGCGSPLTADKRKLSEDIEKS